MGSQKQVNKSVKSQQEAAEKKATDDFLNDIQAVFNKHRRILAPALEFTINGVFPKHRIVKMNDEVQQPAVEETQAETPAEATESVEPTDVSPEPVPEQV